MTDHDIARYKAELPLAFRVAPAVRLRQTLVLTGFALLVMGCLIAFDFSPQRIWTGLSRLGGVLSFMLPPKIFTDPQDLADIAKGLGETLSMAFLGTVLGRSSPFRCPFWGPRT